MSKRDQWRKTVAEQLSINDHERQSVRRIMSRLRGNNSTDSDPVTPSESGPASEPGPVSGSGPVSEPILMPGSGPVPDLSVVSETIPVSTIAPSYNDISSTTNAAREVVPVEILDRRDSHTGAEIAQVEVSIDAENETGIKMRPVDKSVGKNQKYDLLIEKSDTRETKKVNSEYEKSKLPELRPVEKSIPVGKLEPVTQSDRYETTEETGQFLKLPIAILDNILPGLTTTEAVLYLRLYRLAAGQNSTTCLVGITALTQACNISEQTCRITLRRLIEQGHIKQLQVINTRDIKGTIYEILTGAEFIPVK